MSLQNNFVIFSEKNIIIYTNSTSYRLYPVDKKRVNEYGQKFEDETDDKGRPSDAVSKETKKTKWSECVLHMFNFTFCSIILHEVAECLRLH